MQIFVRDLQGASHAFTCTTPEELQKQVEEAFDLPPTAARLSYASRSLPRSLEDLPRGATVDVLLRLPGGGPKKRCAYISAKDASTSSAPSGSSTPAKADASTSESADAGQSSEGAGAAQVTNADMAAAVTGNGPTADVQQVMERCSSAALRMIGDCPRCEKSFCGAHRLPEDHACPALANFRKAAFDENRAKLEKEATIASKISAF